MGLAPISPPQTPEIHALFEGEIGACPNSSHLPRTLRWIACGRLTLLVRMARLVRLCSQVKGRPGVFLATFGPSWPTRSVTLAESRGYCRWFVCDHRDEREKEH